MTAAQTERAKPNLSAIEAEIKRLGGSDELCRLVVGLIESMAGKNLSLQARLDAAMRQLYSRKSEKISPDQLLLFLSKLPTAEAQKAGVEVPAPADDGSPVPPAPDDKPKPKPKPHGKRAFPAHLPHRTEKVLVPEAERRCTCGADKVALLTL